ncbi:MAG TPA: hypothetical protein VFU59_12410 [Candidatus Eisenbacteria bacterium]|nr:hypothetical protein [Candidatus Eisenbacteria bacterium]
MSNAIRSAILAGLVLASVIAPVAAQAGDEVGGVIPALAVSIPTDSAPGNAALGHSAEVATGGCLFRTMAPMPVSCSNYDVACADLEVGNACSDTNNNCRCISVIPARCRLP